MFIFSAEPNKNIHPVRAQVLGTGTKALDPYTLGTLSPAGIHKNLPCKDVYKDTPQQAGSLGRLMFIFSAEPNKNIHPVRAQVLGTGTKALDPYTLGTLSPAGIHKNLPCKDIYKDTPQQAGSLGRLMFIFSAEPNKNIHPVRAQVLGTGTKALDPYTLGTPSPAGIHKNLPCKGIYKDTPQQAGSLGRLMFIFSAEPNKNIHPVRAQVLGTGTKALDPYTLGTLSPAGIHKNLPCKDIYKDTPQQAGSLGRLMFIFSAEPNKNIHPVRAQVLGTGTKALDPYTLGTLSPAGIHKNLPCKDIYKDTPQQAGSLGRLMFIFSAEPNKNIHPVRAQVLGTGTKALDPYTLGTLSPAGIHRNLPCKDIYKDTPQQAGSLGRLMFIFSAEPNKNIHPVRAQVLGTGTKALDPYTLGTLSPAGIHKNLPCKDIYKDTPQQAGSLGRLMFIFSAEPNKNIHPVRAQVLGTGTKALDPYTLGTLSPAGIHKNLPCKDIYKDTPQQAGSLGRLMFIFSAEPNKNIHPVRAQVLGTGTKALDPYTLGTLSPAGIHKNLPCKGIYKDTPQQAGSLGRLMFIFSAEPNKNIHPVRAQVLGTGTKALDPYTLGTLSPAGIHKNLPCKDIYKDTPQQAGSLGRLMFIFSAEPNKNIHPVRAQVLGTGTKALDPYTLGTLSPAGIHKNLPCKDIYKDTPQQAGSLGRLMFIFSAEPNKNIHPVRAQVLGTGTKALDPYTLGTLSPAGIHKNLPCKDIYKDTPQQAG